MVTTETKLRRDIGARLREFEEYLERFEERLQALHRRIDRASGAAEAELGSLLADVEREADLTRSAGEAVLRELRRAVEIGRGAVERAEARLKVLEKPRLPAAERGKAAVRRAAIEVKALRHGVRVGLRMARRVSHRRKTAAG
ncbi:MAG: hypothetical protein HY712_02390 [candidate division NC10 bacterium]|nr:hypothetical protein [candidate division NC10 bacterium]